MMKKIKTIILTCLLCLVAMFLISGVQTEAASGKASKVKITRDSKGDKEFAVLKGKNKKNQIVWKYKTKGYVAPWGDPIKCVVHKKRVYVFEVNKLTVLKKTTGKKLWSIEIPYIGEYECEFQGNQLYVIGMSGPLKKIDAKGNVIWSAGECDCAWHGNMKVKNGKITVRHDVFYSDRGEEAKVTYSAQTGQILKEKYL